MGTARRRHGGWALLPPQDYSSINIVQDSRIAGGAGSVDAAGGRHPLRLRGAQACCARVRASE